MPKGSVIEADPAAVKETTKLFTAEINQDFGAVFAGLAMAAFEEAFKYSKARIQGGVPIFEHKNIRLALFEMFTMVEAARANARRTALYCSENPGAPSFSHAAAAKCLSTETAARVASQAIQVFGGYGLAKEYPLEKFFRDAHAGRVEYGANEALALEAMDDF